MIKAARILGLPAQAVRKIAVDGCFRMDTDELQRAVDADQSRGHLPFLVVANAGTTNTGSVDPLEELADFCKERKLWFHVDAAYGGFAAITQPGRELLKGMQRADSLTLDPHKWLYCPMGIGCVLVRKSEFLEKAFSTYGDYLKDLPRDEVNFLDRGPELSRPARVLSVWMVIRSVGREMLARQIGEDMRLARLAARLLGEDSRLEVDVPDLSVVTFRHRLREAEEEVQRAARDTALMEATLASGELMLSTTTLQGRSSLRLVVMNHRTNESEIRRSVTGIRALLT